MLFYLIIIFNNIADEYVDIYILFVSFVENPLKLTID